MPFNVVLGEVTAVDQEDTGEAFVTLAVPSAAERTHDHRVYVEAFRRYYRGRVDQALVGKFARIDSDESDHIRAIQVAEHPSQLSA